MDNRLLAINENKGHYIKMWRIQRLKCVFYLFYYRCWSIFYYFISFLLKENVIIWFCLIQIAIF